jgi:dCMP deaminase
LKENKMAFKLLVNAKKDKRPEKDEYYLSIAKQISQRSTCSKRKYGAIIVKEDNIIAAGYMGSPRGTPNCVDLGKCAREKSEKINLNYCRGVHAELNAIINAARTGASVLGGIMYLYVEDIKTNCPIFGKPCKHCRKAIVNAGISEVIVPGAKGLRKYRTEFWVKEQNKYPFVDLD